MLRKKPQAAPTSEQHTLRMQLSSSALASSLSSHVALSTGLYSREPQVPHPAKESISSRAVTGSTAEGCASPPPHRLVLWLQPRTASFLLDGQQEL